MGKFFKKLLKIFLYIFIALCLLLVLAELALRFVLPSQSVKEKTLAYLSQTTGADIKTGDIAASFFGITLNDVAVDVAGQELFTCKKLNIGLSPFKLLVGQLYIKKIVLFEPSVKITRNQDGIFNYEALVSSAEEQEEQKEQKTENAETATETGIPFDVRVHNLKIEKAQIYFTDLKENINASLRDLEFNLNQFSFYKPFNYDLAFVAYFAQDKLVIDGVKFALDAETNLTELNLQGAGLNIKKLLLNYKDIALRAQAQINNFQNPSGDISAELKNLTSSALAGITETVPFNVPLITAGLKFDYLTDAAQANIKNFALKTAGAELNIKANLDLNKNTVSDGKITLTSVLDSLKDISPLIEEYKPKGQINADLDFAFPLALAGNLTLNDVGFFTDKAGTAENINTVVNIKSIDEVNIDSLTGVLNNNPFNAKANYKKQKDFADVFFDFKADKLYVFNTSKPKEEQQPVNVNTPPSQEVSPEEKVLEDAEEAGFPPLNVDAKIDVKKLDVPFIRGNNLVFKAKAKNITAQLNKTHGTFDLSVSNGQIKDIYTISNATSLAKVMFMSLGIVSRVINTLNVIDLLNGMGKMLTGNKEEEEELPVHQEINGKLDFDSFKTNVDFNQGLATMKKCSFVSGLFSFSVNGNINFDSCKIKLNVDSAPGRHTDNGIMPLNIDIKGTIEDPKGSLSVLSSVSDLVTHTITKNPVSNMLKSTWGALFKSDTEEETAESNTENNAENNTAAEEKK